MGYFFNERLQRIDRVDSDGYIYAENLQRIGKIDRDGYVYIYMRKIYLALEELIEMVLS